MSAHGLEAHGFRNLKAVNWNLSDAALYEEAVRRNEGKVAKHGPLVVLTGHHTGRSASDKFVVKDAKTEPPCLVGQQQGDEPGPFRCALSPT